MHQEVSETKKGSAVIDIVLVAILVLMMVFIRTLLNLTQALPQPLNQIGTVLIFVILVGICYYIYAKRICSYRYTTIYAQPKEGELNAFGEAAPYSYDVGTVCFERMIANKGKIALMVLPEEIIALIAPDEPFPTLPARATEERCTTLPVKNAHKLIYKQKNRYYYASFTPSEKLVGYIKAFIENRSSGSASANVEASTPSGSDA